MLEPYAVKVASTVLRRELHREMGFLSDNIVVKENIAFIATSEGLTIVNIENFNDFKEITTFTTGAFVTSSYPNKKSNAIITDITIKEDIAYLSASINGSWPYKYLIIVDISNVHTPFELSKLLLHAEDNIYNIEIYDNIAVIPSYTKGLTFVDISDLKNPQKISTFNPGGYYDKTTYCKVIGSKVYTLITKNDKTYKSMFATIDISNIKNPIIKNSIKLKENKYNFYIIDNFAYLSGVNLTILDKSNISSQTVVANINTVDIPNKLLTLNNTLYVGGPNFIEIFDISNLKTPKSISFFSLGGSTVDMEINNNLLYTLGTYGITIIDIMNPYNIIELSQLYIESFYVHNIEVNDNTAFVTQSYSEGYHLYGDIPIIVDISNPYQPVEVENNSLWVYAYDIKIKNNIAYLVKDKISGMYIFNVTDPLNAIELASYYLDVGSVSGSIEINDNYAFVPLENGGITLIDVSNPSAPSEIANVNSNVYTFDVIANDNIFYAANGELGISLVIFLILL